MSSGLTHSAAVKQNGKLYTWGVGLCGQLGHGFGFLNSCRQNFLHLDKDEDNQMSVLRRNDDPGAQNMNKVAPDSLEYTDQTQITPAMVKEKKLWIPCVPLPSSIDTKVCFKHVSCGSHHTMAVSMTGDVYGCGLSTRGRLGLNQQQVNKTVSDRVK